MLHANRHFNMYTTYIIKVPFNKKVLSEHVKSPNSTKSHINPYFKGLLQLWSRDVDLLSLIPTTV